MLIERDVVLAIADQRLSSPQVFYGAAFIAMRITGTWCAWRNKNSEFVVRDPSIWIDDPTMALRWLGAPVVLTHPPSGTLDTASYVRTVIGAVVHAYPRVVEGRPELWCVARISDMDVAEMIVRDGADTSPAVVFAGGTARPIELENGERWLIEPTPVFIDHLACVSKGVWSKGGPPSGVEINADGVKS